jgi:BirA family biotin operon repressor/biotin-[acetyl-CoA-carboxylase] ligase
MLPFQIHRLDEVSSTNTLAKKFAAEDAAEGTVIVAEHQSEGRGKPGRTWESPPGKDLLFSIILRPPVSASEAPMLTQIACRSVAAVLRNQYGLKPVFKRPNDVLVSGKKICGILTETSSCGDKLEAVVVGIGLNANASGPGLFPGSTSIRAETETETDRNTLLSQLLTQIEIDLRPFYSKFNVPPPN